MASPGWPAKTRLLRASHLTDVASIALWDPVSGPGTWLLVCPTQTQLCSWQLGPNGLIYWPLWASGLKRIFLSLCQKSLPAEFAVVALGWRLRIYPILSLERRLSTRVKNSMCLWTGIRKELTFIFNTPELKFGTSFKYEHRHKGVVALETSMTLSPVEITDHSTSQFHCGRFQKYHLYKWLLWYFRYHKTYTRYFILQVNKEIDISTHPKCGVFICANYILT